MPTLPLRAALEYHHTRQGGRGIVSSRFSVVHTNTEELENTDEEDGHDNLIIKYGRDSQLLCPNTLCLPLVSRLQSLNRLAPQRVVKEEAFMVLVSLLGFSSFI